MKRSRFQPGRGAVAIDAASLALDFLIADEAPIVETRGTVAIVDIRGPLMQHPDWCFDSYDGIRERVTEALESPCSAVVLRIDSPGGEAQGCFELAREIRAKAATAGKRVVAYVDSTAASAAYAIACAASQIYVPESGRVGSIGCVQTVLDATAANRSMGLAFTVIASGKRKADGNPFVPLSEEAVKAIQGEVDELAGVFFALVAEARSMSPKDVAGLEASMFIGASAVKAGLADQVITFDGLLAMVASGGTTAQVGAEDTTMTEREKAIAALKAMAADGDDKDKEDANAALKALGEGGEESTGDEVVGDGDAKAAEPAEDDDAKAKASAALAEEEKEKGTDALALAARVQALEAERAETRDREERAKLMASRPDLAPDVVKFLAKQPLATVRDAVKTFAKGPARPATAGGAVGAARAALGAQGTPGEGASDRAADPAAEAERNDLDVRMGLKPASVSAVRNDGTRQILGVMTPAAARAQLKAREGAAK